MSEAIIDVLKKGDKPMVIDEIAFRARTSRSAINEVMTRLQKAKIIVETEDDKFRLNSQDDYDFSEAYK